MLRIRQLALAAQSLAAPLETLLDVLGLEVAYRDPGVATFGLENAVIASGGDFLEIVAPTRADTAAGRWIERQGGDAGYMVILQTDAFDVDRTRIEATKTRIVWEIEHDGARAVHLHPRDVGGAILSFDAMPTHEHWLWAGPRWRETRASTRVGAVVAAHMASPDPEALATRWGGLCDRPVVRDGDVWRLQLDGNALLFAAGEREALVGIDLAARDGAAFLAAAERAGVRSDDGAAIGGVRFRAVA